MLTRPARPLLALLATAALAGCGADEGGESSATPTTTAAAATSEFGAAASTAVTDVEAGTATLVDVRTQEEWDEGHAPQARHVPLADLEAGELPTDIPKDAKVYVYCRSGNRSGVAIGILEQAGYTDVTNIGGLTDWQAAGGDVTS